MTIRKITANGNEYEFINDSRNTRSGFAHDTTLFRNGEEIGRATAIYYNRTWERYRYQTAMQICINDIIEKKYEDYIKFFKEFFCIKRLTSERRVEADRNFYECIDIKELQEVCKQLESSN